MQIASGTCSGGITRHSEKGRIWVSRAGSPVGGSLYAGHVADWHMRTVGARLIAGGSTGLQNANASFEFGIFAGGEPVAEIGGAEGEDAGGVNVGGRDPDAGLATLG